MPVFTLQINGKEYKADVAPDTPILWVLRDHLGLVGTKFGCGIAQCGACTIHFDGNAVRSWHQNAFSDIQHLAFPSQNSYAECYE